MDGFHYYKHELEKFKDPQEAFKRRGVHWTFNSKAFSKLLKELKHDHQVSAPSFDHKIGDPIEKDIHVTENTKIIIVEGNYLSFDNEEWMQVSKEFDERWFLECPIEIAMARLEKRHMEAFGFSSAEARNRVDTNDRLNALEILAHQLLPFHRIISSVEDPTFSAE
eukprot:TRINITY_DN1143_c0_g1_i1.p1 TRINITY_DN1143_c0_g1~~TRINITY_DN1143_c0_g1_i1.p1  ORF type:complete len:166 (+),score=29.23 TRINITY_DN1143_c0_g1_i1:214-711(+)